jgi:uncharacterized protein (DUF433 family)
MKTRIVRNPKIMVGKPTIEGTRITVEFVLNLIEQGQTIPEIIDEYDLTEDQVKAAINYAKTGLEKNYPAQRAVAHAIFVGRKHQ